jgi:hypothetical protein
MCKINARIYFVAAPADSVRHKKLYKAATKAMWHIIQDEITLYMGIEDCDELPSGTMGLTVDYSVYPFKTLLFDVLGKFTDYCLNNINKPWEVYESTREPNLSYLLKQKIPHFRIEILGDDQEYYFVMYDGQKLGNNTFK